MIGERLKHVFMGCQAWILSYRDECFDHIGLRPKEKIRLMNGELTCEYRGYELFAGTNKDYRKAQHEAPPPLRPERPTDRKPIAGKPRITRQDLAAMREAIARETPYNDE